MAPPKEGIQGVLPSGCLTSVGGFLVLCWQHLMKAVTAASLSGRGMPRLCLLLSWFAGGLVCFVLGFGVMICRSALDVAPPKRVKSTSPISQSQGLLFCEEMPPLGLLARPTRSTCAGNFQISGETEMATPLQQHALRRLTQRTMARRTIIWGLPPIAAPPRLLVSVSEAPLLPF